jgi:hypothetical protein
VVAVAVMALLIELFDIDVLFLMRLTDDFYSVRKHLSNHTQALIGMP